MPLPKSLESLFWDCDFGSLDLNENRSFIIRRILDQGGWQAITWLRDSLGDDSVRRWFLAKRGHGLDPRRLRFWGVILDLPKDQVDQWVRQARMSSWHKRAAA